MHDYYYPLRKNSYTFFFCVINVFPIPSFPAREGLSRDFRPQKMYNSRPPRSPRPQEVQRRESLVKPTWQNVNPGQVSPSTLNATFAAGMSDGVGFGTQNQPPLEVANMNNNAITSGKQPSIQQQRREVELYDIFSKVHNITN